MAGLLGSVAASPRPKITELDPRVREDDNKKQDSVVRIQESVEK